jgi:hypothetical protein
MWIALARIDYEDEQQRREDSELDRMAEESMADYRATRRR